MEKSGEPDHREILEQETEDWGSGATSQQGSLEKPPRGDSLLGMTCLVASSTLGCQGGRNSGAGAARVREEKHLEKVN